MKIGFLGLGRMGHAMATNLLKADHELTVFNRTAEKAAPLRELGATVATTPAEAARTAEVIFTMVTDDAALLELTTGEANLATALPAGAVHVSCSTVAPDTNRQVAAAHARHGAHLVAAPVFGKPDVAAAAKLWIGTAGPAEAKAKIAPLLAVLGQGTHDFGDDPGAANVVKLCGNFMLGAAIEAMAEAFTLAQKSGIERQRLYEFFTTTLFDCGVYKNYGKLIATEHYQPVGAPPSVIRKDLKLLLQEGRDKAVPLPFANIVFDQLTATMNRGDENIDWSSFAQRVSDNAGLGQ